MHAVGTFDYHYHILYAWMTGGGPAGSQYSPKLVPENCVYQMEYITKMACGAGRVPLPNPAAYPCPMMTGYTYYFESDILGSVGYPEGVKLITASFVEAFGLPLGDQVRQLCLNNKWGLVWVMADASKCYDPRRMLDLTVLPSTTLNATVAPAVSAAFTTMWSTRLTDPKWNATYATKWSNYTNETLNPGVGDTLLWNIGVRDCENYDACVGITDSTGTCVCYPE